jgi:fermentation-respiration switch protein FrsA (DUF1100 family)
MLQSTAETRPRIDAMRTTLTALRRILVAIVAALVFWTAILMLFEERFVFFPRPFPSGPYDDAKFIPGLQEHWVRAADGSRLHAWFAPVDSPIAVILHSHGNGGNLSYDIERIRRFQRAGLAFFAYDYRGYGKSEGAPSEAGVILDAIAAYDHLRDSLHVPASEIIVWGTSLGGAVAVQLAAQRPVAGLILESTFTSAPDVAALAYPFLPVRWLMRTSFNSVAVLPSLSLPTLHIHGDRDEVIDVDLGRRLYEAARGPKAWYEVPGAGHNDVLFVGGAEYLHRITAFARSCVQR